MKTIDLKYVYLAFVGLVLLGCKKSNFLNAKPDQSQVVPTTVPELQALLDNDLVMNGAGNIGIIPGFGEIGADNYYITDDLLTAYVDPLEKNAYRWQKNLYANEEIIDWDFPYRSIFYANEVLDGIGKTQIIPDQQAAWNNAKGSALFYRAHMFFQLAQVFAAPYDSLTANGLPGLPLRLHSDINEQIERSSLKQTYDQITSDLLESVPLLPVTPLYKTRPSKPAAYGLLARVYLSMENYDLAFLYADSSLQMQNTLIDYNTVDTTASLPFVRFNAEVIFHAVILTNDLVIVNALATIDSNLYNSYGSNDLRKPVYFVGGAQGGSLATGPIFKGSYDGSSYYFAGIATDEIYLIRAECNARKGKVTASMSDLNALLVSRWIAGTFVPLAAVDASDALDKVLIERRKELIFRATRWTDLRRLNKDSRYAITLNRIVEGQPYSLPPNDNRYVYPIPPAIISFNPGMTQNPR